MCELELTDPVSSAVTHMDNPPYYRITSSYKIPSVTSGWSPTSTIHMFTTVATPKLSVSTTRRLMSCICSHRNNLQQQYHGARKWRSSWQQAEGLQHGGQVQAETLYYSLCCGGRVNNWSEIVEWNSYRASIKTLCNKTLLWERIILASAQCTSSVIQMEHLLISQLFHRLWDLWGETILNWKNVLMQVGLRWSLEPALGQVLMRCRR